MATRANGRLLQAAIVGGLACALLSAHMVLAKSELDLSEVGSPRRYWEDLSVAIKAHLDRQSPPDPQAAPGNIDDAGEVCRILVNRGVKLQGVRPWEFWRTIPTKPFWSAQERFARGRFFEDQGRAFLLALGFRILGGIAPFLLVWLGVLACMPVLLWLAAELCLAGRPLVALVFCTLLVCSPYFVDCLSLPHSGVGFYLIGILTVVCLAVYTALHPAISSRGLFMRAGVASLVFALCTLVRSGTLLISLGFALGLAIGCWRAAAPQASTRSRAIRVARALAFLLLLFPLPYLLVRPAEHHFVWSDIWKGIGDFDREKVHPNKDGEATKELGRAGVPLGPDPGFPFVSPETEVYFRASVLRDIRSDPGWYAVILIKRVFATVTQQRLWPMTWEDGRSMALSTHPNEGNTDKYYRMTATADWLGLAEWRMEFRISILGAPLAALVLVWLVALARRQRDLARHAGQALLVVACAAVAALGLPVVITTAGGLETQAFVLTYYLGWAFTLDGFARAVRSSALGASA